MAAGDSSQIFEDLMRFKPDGMTPNGWATKAGVSRTVWADMRRHGNPSRKTLQKLLAVAGSSLAEFEALRIGALSSIEAGSGWSLGDRSAPPWGAARPPFLPLVATAMGGQWTSSGRQIEVTELRAGELVDRLPRPPSLANDPSAYAIVIVGDSMWPRFRPGRRVAVSPAAPVAIGDDVLVKLKKSDGHDLGRGTVRALIMELVGQTSGGVQLKQFNPDATFEVPAADIAAIEKVAGELI